MQVVTHLFEPDRSESCHSCRKETPPAIATGRIRTCDLRVMSPARYCFSTVVRLRFFVGIQSSRSTEQQTLTPSELPRLWGVLSYYTIIVGRGHTAPFPHRDLWGLVRRQTPACPYCTATDRLPRSWGGRATGGGAGASRSLPSQLSEVEAVHSGPSAE